MNGAKRPNIDPLDSILGTREMVEDLFSRNLISAEAKQHALKSLYPNKNWGFWIARLLSAIGITLILTGIIYFFAFNWTKMSTLFKFSSIQITLFATFAASYYYGLQKLSGKIFLLSASILVGVFLAVFGQVYQTGADSYNLFLMWSLLILPLVIISRFTPLWVIWLSISNICLILFWNQTGSYDSPGEMMILSYLALFNGVFLILREYFSIKGINWLRNRWTRMILIIPILIYIFIPTYSFIMDPKEATYSVIVGVLFSAIIHTIFYIIYRYKLPDIWSVAITLFSICIILETIFYKEIFLKNNSIAYLLMGSLTLILFTLAVFLLQNITKKMKKTHG